MQLSKFKHFLLKGLLSQKNIFDGSFGLMVLLMITVVALLLYALLIGYYHYHWKRLETVVATKEVTFPVPFISVVVAARNEAANLPHLLKALQAQTYPSQQFEVLIVDDFSIDNTQNVLKPFCNHRVRVIQPAVEASFSNKKRAIETGIKTARGNLIVVTDADCLPQPQWLAMMAQFHQKTGAVFIAAPVKFTHDGRLLQVFQAVDFLTLQGITAASVSAGFHSMCNGANLAYTKAAFEAVNGFEGIDKVASGDDMLLMHKIKMAHPGKVHYLKSKSAIVTTQPMFSWNDFIMQRRRWASKTVHYDDKAVFYVLLFVYLFNCLFAVLAVASFFDVFYLYLLLGYLFLKTGVEWPFVQSVASFYGEQKLMRYFPLLQPLHIIYTISVGFISQLGKYEWKGRKLK